ncbi:hypothetical protein GKE62_09080 [Novosphingobium sp. Gsoil 351]|nr:hypothetical protein GKE62_09080 [Novosphingobium sp. Gsoil 351]
MHPRHVVDIAFERRRFGGRGQRGVGAGHDRRQQVALIAHPGIAGGPGALDVGGEGLGESQFGLGQIVGVAAARALEIAAKAIGLERLAAQSVELRGRDQFVERLGRLVRRVALDPQRAIAARDVKPAQRGIELGIGVERRHHLLRRQLGMRERRRQHRCRRRRNRN